MSWIKISWAWVDSPFLGGQTNEDAKDRKEAGYDLRFHSLLAKSFTVPSPVTGHGVRIKPI